MATNYNPRTITDGLVLCLDAANRKSYPGSGTTWTDLSGSGNTGTLVNGVGYSGDNLGSLSFDGVDDYVDVGSNSNFSFGTGNFTIECWYRRNGSQPDFSSFLCTGTSAATTNWQLCFGGSAVSPTSVNMLTFFIGGAADLYLYDTVISPNLQWIYACVTRSGTLVSLYKNGSLISSGTNSSNLTDQGLRMGINRGSTVYLSGNISNIRLYKGKALTAQEVQQNFNALRSRFSI
jgi:hypothetical protein